MYGMLKTILAFSGSRRRILLRSLILSFVSGMLSALQFAALYVVIHALTAEHPGPAAAGIAAGILVISLLGRMLLGYHTSIEQTQAGYGMVADSRIRIGDRIRYVPMGYFNRHGASSVSAVVTTTLGDVENAASRVLVSVMGGILSSAALVVIMLMFNRVIGVIAALGAMIYLAVSEPALRRSERLSIKRQTAQSELSDSVLEYVQGMEVIRAFASGEYPEQDSSQSVLRSIDASCRGNLRLTKSGIPFEALKQTVLRLFSTMLLLVSIRLWLDGELSASTGIVMVIASFMVFSDLENAGNMTALLQLLAVSIDRAREEETLPVMTAGTEEPLAKSSEIVFDRVSFSYHNEEQPALRNGADTAVSSGRPVLNHVSAVIPEGTMTAIVGPSGAGKTTMCRLIARFWDVTDGSISIGGIDVRSFSPDSLMRNISIVFQNVYLFADTIENNIKFGCPDATHAQVEAAARKACCHDFISALPDGYDTVIGEGGATLSGGERQRISIARALLKDAPIILLDEAVSSVDPENEDLILRAIERLTQDKTIVMIAHRLETVRKADQILVLENGQIVQRGTHEELIRQGGLYADFTSARREAIEWSL